MRISKQFAHRCIRTGILGLFILLLSACGGTGGSTNSTTTSNATPIKRTLPAGKITEFPVTSGSQPAGITAGPDGNLWFTSFNEDYINRITPTGTFNKFPVPTSNSQPLDITSGPDGNLWFTENRASKIGRITQTGTVTEFAITTPNSIPVG